jgi:hypothetical protein
LEECRAANIVLKDEVRALIDGIDEAAIGGANARAVLGRAIGYMPSRPIAAIISQLRKP